MKLSHFPEDCKVGKLKPLLKKAETNAKNFRSISLLDTVTKFIKKVIYDQTVRYLAKITLSTNITLCFARTIQRILLFRT